MWISGVFRAIFIGLGSVQVKTSPNQCGSIRYKAPELSAPVGHCSGDHRLGQRLPKEIGPITESTNGSCRTDHGENTFRINSLDEISFQLLLSSFLLFLVKLDRFFMQQSLKAEFK